MDRVKKLSDIKGERAFDAFADLIQPVTDMAADSEAVELFSNGKKQNLLEKAASMMRVASKNRNAFIAIETIKRGGPADDMSMDDILNSCLELMNDPMFNLFFALAHRDMERKTSIIAPEPTEAPAE